jgi:hypothetical protein
MPPTLLQVLKGLFNDSRAFIAINGSQSPSFPLISGVLQGSPLSRVLYSLFINDHVQDLNQLKAPPGATRLAGRLFQCLLYANDIVVLSNSEVDARRMLHAAEFHSLRNRYKFGIAKCQVISSKAVGPFHTYSQSLQFVDEFVYLGVPFNVDGIAWITASKEWGQNSKRLSCFPEVWSLSPATEAPSHMEMAISKSIRLGELNSLADAIPEMTGDRIIMFFI